MEIRNVVLLLFWCFLAFVVIRRLVSFLEIHQFKKQHGCKPAVKYRQLDPILGIDIYRQGKKNAANHVGLEKHLERCLAEGRTMTMTTMGQSFTTTCDPENLKAILATNFKDFSLGGRVASMGKLLGSGIFTTDGPHWARSRALIRPSFTRAQVADLDSIESHVQKLVGRLPEDGTTVDIQPLFFNLTIDSSTEFLLGRSINCQTEPAMLHFSEAWDYAEQCLPNRVRLGKLAFLVKDQKFEDSCRTVHKFVDDYIAERLDSKEDVQLGAGKSRRYNLLSELSTACDDPVQLRNELLNVLLAARDTTAGLLSSVFYFLARHPEVWTKLAEEVSELQGKAPDYDALKSMRYLKNVLDETLRLHPPVPVNFRYADHHTTIPRGGGPDGQSPVFIAKGTAVHYSVWVAHRLPEIWGPDAESFRPERWQDPDRPLRPGWGYLPFNGGPRVCLGQQSALIEAGYVVVRLVQHFGRMEARGPVFRENLALTLSHFDGVKVAMWRRQ